MTNTHKPYATTRVPAVIAGLSWLGDVQDLLKPHGLQTQVLINAPGTPHLQHLCMWSLDGWGCCDYSRGNAKQRAKLDAQRHINGKGF